MFPEFLRDFGVSVPSRLESRWTCVNGRTLHSRSSGTLPAGCVPFVLVHGLVISSLYMIPLAECMAGEYDVHALDLPGFGRSDGPAEVLSVRELAEWLIVWMSDVGIHQCHLVANSLGCEIAAHVAIKARERVATLSLIGPTIDPQAFALPLQSFRLIQDALQEPSRLWLNWTVDLWRAGFSRAIGTTREMFRDHIEHSLPHVTAPTLVIRGGNDPTVPQSAALMLTRLIPRGDLLVIEDEPHCVHYTNPLRVWGAIREFARRAAPPSS